MAAKGGDYGNNGFSQDNHDVLFLGVVYGIFFVVVGGGHNDTILDNRFWVYCLDSRLYN